MCEATFRLKLVLDAVDSVCKFLDITFAGASLLWNSTEKTSNR